MEAQDMTFPQDHIGIQGVEGVSGTQALGKEEKGFSPSPPPPTELLPKGSKEEQRDYVFYLAVGNYRLKVRQTAPFSPPSHLGDQAPSPRLSSRLSQGRVGGVGYRGAR